MLQKLEKFSFFFMKSISTLNESEESWMILNKTRANNLLQKIFIKKSCCKGLKYCKFMRKRNKAKHKNTETSSCRSICRSKLQYFNSSIYTSVKLYFVKLYFELSVEIWSQLSR